jgi:hypothetical protein
MQTAHRMNDASEPLGLGSRVLGILTSPRATFERVVVDPRWIGVLALGVGGVAVMSSLLVSTDFAQRAMLDQQVASMEAFGVTVTDEIYAEMERSGQFAAYSTLGFTLIGIPIICALLAGLLYGAGYGLLGAGASFGQVFAVVAHAGVVFFVQQLFVVPLNYARESITAPATLAAFTPMLGDDTFAFKLLSAIDLFFVWWVMILSIGLAVAWKRRTAPIATTLYGIYAGIAVIIAVLRTNFGF